MSQRPEDMMNFNQKPPREQKAQVLRGIVIEREDGGDYDLMRAEQRPRGGAGQII